MRKLYRTEGVVGGNQSWTDYDYAISVRPTLAPMPWYGVSKWYQDTYIGVVFRYQDSKNYYVYRWCYDNTIRLYKVQNGIISEIGSAVSSAFPSTSAYVDLKVSVAGATFKAYKNGVLERTDVAGDFATGSVGAATSFSDTYFKNIAVTPVTSSASVLAGYWKLDESSGLTASDSSGNAYTGTVNNATWTGGKVYNGLGFNGTNSYVSVPSTNDLNFSASQSFTLSAWVNVPSLPGSWKGIITKGRDTASWYGLWISDQNQWVFGAIGGGNVIGPSVTTGWHYVTLVQDGTLNKRSIYVDGIKSSTEGTASNASNSSELWIGGSKGQNEYFNGTIDDVRLYRTALNGTDIQNMMYEATPVGWYKLDDGSGAAIADTSGNGHNGTVNGASWTSGKANGALSFNGSSNYASVADNADYNFSAASSFTVSAWVNVPSLPGAWKGIVTKGRDTSSWYGLWISDQNQWIFGAIGGGNVVGPSVTTGWHHVALVQDGANNKRFIYVDGVAGNQGTAQNASNNSELWIGGSKGQSEFFNGTIDDVRIYNKALNASAVHDLYDYSK